MARPICLHAFTCLCTCVHTHLRTCTTRTCVCPCASVHVCPHLHMCAHMHLYLCAHTPLYTCAHIHLICTHNKQGNISPFPTTALLSVTGLRAGRVVYQMVCLKPPFLKGLPPQWSCLGWWLWSPMNSYCPNCISPPHPPASRILGSL